MRRILTSLMFVASVYSFAQVGVSKNATDTPRATLDVRAMGEATPDGVLIPNVDKGRAQNMTQPENSTLVYITNSGAGGARTVDVDADGFYYFKDTKWVKLGGGAGSSQSASGPAVLGGATGKAQILATPVLASQINADTFAVIVTGSAETTLELPNPADSPNRVISVNNQGGSILTFTGSNQPANTNGVESGAGFFLISAKASSEPSEQNYKWYLIGGVGL